MGHMETIGTAPIASDQLSSWRGSSFISTLADVFDEAGTVLANNGSLWVNIGDTYWSGKFERVTTKLH